MTAPLAYVYSFLDVQATLTAPTASIRLGENGVAREGIRVAMIDEKDRMQIGADGTGMHTLSASRAGCVTVFLQKASPVNAQLSTLYNYQSTSAANWGNIQITITNPVSGDNITCTEGAFVKRPDVIYDGEGPMLAWAFNFVSVQQVLGNGYQPTAF
jgi:hypothetical protein